AAGLKLRWADALELFDREHRNELDEVRMRQFAADEGLANLRAEAAARGIALLGDMPLYPAFESADVWSHQEIFLLYADQRPRYVAGVPPDYFSATGQLCVNPI